MALPSFSSVKAQRQKINSLVFVDSAVRDIAAYRAAMPDGSILHVLAAGADPFRQMADIADAYDGIRSVVVISHATPGKISLGGADYDAQALRQRGLDLSRIGARMAEGADFLLYGCDLAAGQEGHDLIRAFADLTGKDTAASIDTTGHASFGGNWLLEDATGPVSQAPFLTAAFTEGWTDYLAISITAAGTTAVGMRNAMAAAGTNGLTYTGTPSLNAAASTNAFGTFTTSGSNLGMSQGAVLGTGNVTQIPGTPGTFWDGPGTGVTGAGSERDVAQLNFQFIPNTGVTKLVFRIVMGSEEYNEYVGQGYSDNIRILLTGGAYSSTNVAVVPGTGTGIDIDTINNGLNSAYYRDNTIASPPVPDSVLDGHTTVINSINAVTPGTTYTANIAVADFVDNLYNTASFLGYFGASLNLDLDSNNSTTTGTAFNTTYTEGGAAVSIADTDRLITNYDSTNVQSATITLTNAQTADVLTIGTLPSGITGSVNTSVAGVITVTLTGSSSVSNYQSALSAITFSNSSFTPSATARNVTVVLNDGVTNSNTAVTTITVVPVFNYAHTVTKTASAASLSAPGTITYTIQVANTADGAMTGTTFSDALLQGASSKTLTSGPTKTAGDTVNPGTLDVGETWTYTATYAVTQADIDNGGTFSNTFTFDTAQTTPTVSAAATTTITQSPARTIVKTRASGPNPVTAAGQTIGYSIAVANTGNVSLTSVVLTDAQTQGVTALPLTSGPTKSSGDTDADNVLDVGETWIYTASYTVTQADIDNGTTISNTATVTTTQLGALASAALTTPITQSPAQTITKIQSGGPNPIIANGNVLSYSVSVANIGNTSLTNVIVTDVLTQGATALTLTSGPTKSSGDTDADNVLDVGETWVYTASFTVSQAQINDGGTISNIARVDTDQTALLASTAVSTPVTQTRTLSFSKSALLNGNPVGLPLTTVVNANDIITYRYDVTNSGNVTMANVSVSDTHNGNGTLPIPGSEAVLTDAGPSGDSTDATAANGVWSTLAPGDTVRFTATYTVGQTDVDLIQ